MNCPDGHVNCQTIETRVRGTVYACSTCKIRFIVHNEKAKTDDADTAMIVSERRQKTVARG